ncbi:MAG: hypothetical protein MJ211_04840 [Bacteroidales bacterium]|nr:hypothetical protein [Bacteroidales bacterium]
MIYLHFRNNTFNCPNSELVIEIIISAKNKFKSPLQFLNEAINTIDNKYPYDEIKKDYIYAKLQEGDFIDFIEE